MKKFVSCLALTVSLVLCLFGAALAESGEESLFSYPLWVNAKYREEPAQDEPYREFVPGNPQNKTWVLMLGKESQYRPQGRPVREKVEEAFYMLEGDLEVMTQNIKAVFSGHGMTNAADPNYASVAIVVNIEFPYGGKYGVGGLVRAYNCELTLTAYDLITHELIAELSVGDYFGDTVNVSPNTYHLYKDIPDPNESENKDAFIQALLDFWNDWTPPEAMK